MSPGDRHTLHAGRPGCAALFIHLAERRAVPPFTLNSIYERRLLTEMLRIAFRCHKYQLHPGDGPRPERRSPPAATTPAAAETAAAASAAAETAAAASAAAKAAAAPTAAAPTA